MSTKGGPVFTFNLPGGRLASLSPSVTPLRGGNAAVLHSVIVIQKRYTMG